MRIYTRSGDDGTTGLFGGERVAKDGARLDAYGTVDELNAACGLARAHLGESDGELDARLRHVQEDLFLLGAELATPDDAAKSRARTVAAADIERLEREIDSWEAALEPLTSFILPAGSPAAAALHVARTVCRRAERTVVSLGRQTELRPEVTRYLNRLSDHLFVAARAASLAAGIKDECWLP